MGINYIRLESCLFQYDPGMLPEQTDVDSLNKEITGFLIKIILQNKSKNEFELTDIRNFSLVNNRLTLKLKNGDKFTTKEIKDIETLTNSLGIQTLKMTRDTVGERIIKMANENKNSSLYLFSSGGGGHRSAKEAITERDLLDLCNAVKLEPATGNASIIDIQQTEESLKETIAGIAEDERLTDPTKLAAWCKKMGLIHEVDVLCDYLGRVGVWAAEQWDHAQQNGDVKTLIQMASQQWISDRLFGPIIFFSTLISLIRTRPSKVVNTQTLAIPSILLAISCYNHLFKPSGEDDVRMDLYMTDMPTEQAVHFFDSLKRIFKTDGKKLLTLFAPTASFNEFDWPKLCGLDTDQVKELEVKDFPIRLDFLQARDSYRADANLKIKISCQEELKSLNAVLNHQGQQTPITEDAESQISYTMNEDDKGYFIMLGSQPTEKAILNYVDQFIEMAKKNSNKEFRTFVFTGRFNAKNDCFYKRFTTHLLEKSDWPKNLKILPLSYQSARQLVGLEMACDTITRSGGATVMELLALNEIKTTQARKRYIHVEDSSDGTTLANSIPHWEKGNFDFLCQLVNSAGNELVNAISPSHLLEKLEA